MAKELSKFTEFSLDAILTQVKNKETEIDNIMKEYDKDIPKELKDTVRTMLSEIADKTSERIMKGALSSLGGIFKK